MSLETHADMRKRGPLCPGYPKHSVHVISPATSNSQKTCGDIPAKAKLAVRPSVVRSAVAARRLSRLPLRATRAACVALLALVASVVVLSGCGSGGYAGTGITGLSTSDFTIDAGQSFPVTAKLSGAALVSWSISSNACTASACGSLSSSTGTAVTYTAPAGIISQLKLTLTAAITGTTNSDTVSVTVNPDPVISGTPPAGIVGTPYSTTFTSTGGTSPLAWSIVGSLPAGLSFNASTHTISGTPTAPGVTSFDAQIIDSSDVPFTVKTAESITITEPVSALSVGGNPPPGTVGVVYSTSLTATGGTTPYTWSILSGALPAGLSISATTGVISGVPTEQGTSVFTAQVEDASGDKASGTFSITIDTKTPLVLNLGTLPGAIVGTPYSATVGVSGGSAPYTCAVTGGTLPPGLAMAADCLVSGTPTTAGTFTVTVKATDSSNPAETTSGLETITVSAAGSLALTSPPDGMVGTPYSGAIGVSGGTAPYTCAITGGALPAGLSMAANCAISGTPTTAETAQLTVKATDASNPARTITGPVSLTISGTPLTLTLSTLPGAVVGTPYSATIGVSGGTGPYSCLLTAGTLPAGLTLSSECIVSGTPTVAGESTVTVKATDSSSPVETTSGPESITVSAAGTLALTSPANGTVGVAYNGNIGVNGGTGPYTCVITNGALPTGLTLGAGCAVSGTPTAAGTSNLTVKATDSSNPTKTTTGPVSLTIVPTALSLTLSTLPGATVNVPYSAAIGVSGGTSPYTCSLVSGTLPAGLTLSTTCVVSGTPTTAGTSNVTVKATDSSNPVETTTGPESITVSAAAPTLVLSNLPNATVGVAYNGTIGVTGGTAPYNCTLIAGTLPAGLSMNSCVVSGTPTVAGTVSLTVKATDSSSPAATTTGPVGLTVLPAAAQLTITSPPNATVGTPYSGLIGVTGGTAPYTCVLNPGTLLPAGLMITNCTISGTPTTPGPVTVSITATDSSNPVLTKTGPVTITVLPATAVLTLSSPPNATVSVPYTGTIGVAGGTAPYSCTITAGTLPAGLTLGAGCVITGTPTVAGTSTVTVHATDSATPTAGTVTGPVSITVSPIPLLTLTGSVPNAILGVPYTQTLTAAGGIPPYTFSVTAGALPAGLTLSPAGVISGTPTAVGASSFTATVTDTEPTPQTASLPLVLLVVYPTTPTDAELVGPYAFLFQGYDDVVAGVLAYQTATVGSFTADGTGVVSAGELDSNHESSNPAGNTISSNQFLGTYTLAANNTGSLTLTTLNADGTTGSTATYAITVKAPVAPAAVATQADLIRFDDNNLEGTKGSGTMLAQQAASFTAGLNGSYAFGLSGDTPCLPACTVGIIAGPVASVGAFTTNGEGLITTGTSDANIATTKYVSAILNGTYGSADSNGRLDLTMDTAGTPVGIYPTDYAVYMVSANEAFVMSTDKHSDYVLLAGTAQLQTQATFSNASMNGAIIGYENAQSNPGLLGTTLGDTLNLSTATIFRATDNGAGTCNTTNVDVGGATALVNGLTGLGSGSNILNALLGTYQSTGTSSCTVASNGRGVLNYPTPSGALTLVLELLGLSPEPPAPREFYLVSPNSGYFLETGYAGLGRFEPQTGGPFSLATLDGTYVYASQPASSLASINSSGTFVANGTGSATTTVDENIGVGTINVLETGVTSTSAYTLNSATDGRYLLGTTTVIYAINPKRFVLVDTNPLTTSPSISLLY